MRAQTRSAQNGSFGSDGSANPPPAAAAASFCFFCVARKSEKGKVYGTLASLHLAASLRGVWSPVLPRYAVSARLVRTAHNKWRSRPGQAAPLVRPVRLPQGCGTAAARLRHSMATCQHSWSLLGFSAGMPRIGSRRPRTIAKPASPLELVNSTFSISHAPDMHSLIFCVSAEYLRPACEQEGEPPAGDSVQGSV